MLCDNCHKNEATIYYTETINGYHTEQHLCKECANESGAATLGKFSPFTDKEFSLGSLLSTVLGYHNNYTGENYYVANDLHCDKCGMTYKEFLKKGKFGCSNCISSFYSEINNSLKRIHGSDLHVGKKPINYVSNVDNIDDTTESLPVGEDSDSHKLEEESSGGSETKKEEAPNICVLQDRLNQAIQLEEYEEAAKIRDEIRILKKAEEEM